MKHLLIGTAGHVDHGKTALIKKLTGIDTDRLPDEKKRGITIDLGFARMKLEDGNVASIIDVPGHEKFIKNMLAGAGGIDLVLLVVAADDGVMPQTREHLGILELLGTNAGIIVVTKTDLVDAGWLELISEDIKNFVGKSFLKDAPIAYVSSHTGQGIDELKKLIAQKIAVSPGKNTAAPPRLPVDRVFTMDGFGTVATGTLIEGTLSMGGTVQIFPSMEEARIRGLQVHGSEVKTAYAGQRVAVNLSGVSKENLKRGDTLASPNTLQATRMIDVKINIFNDAKRELKSGQKLHFHYGTACILCKVVLMDKEKLSAGMEGYAQLRFLEAAAVKRGDPFVLRFYSPTTTVGGGTVLNEYPKKYRKSRKPETIKAMESLEHGDASSHILQAIDSAGFAKLDDIKNRFAHEAAEWANALNKLANDGLIAFVGEKHVISHVLREKTEYEITNCLKNYYADNPLQKGIRKEELRSQIMPGVSQNLFDSLLALYDAALTTINGKVGLKGHAISYTKEQGEIKKAIEKYLLDAGCSPPPLSDLLANFHKKSSKTASQVMDALIEEGTVVLTEPGMVFHANVVAGAKNAFSSLAAKGSVTLAVFRDEIKTSRKFALSLLEYFDKTKFTKKTGDSRELV